MIAIFRERNTVIFVSDISDVSFEGGFGDDLSGRGVLNEGMIGGVVGIDGDIFVVSEDV